VADDLDSEDSAPAMSAADLAKHTIERVGPLAYATKVDARIHSMGKCRLVKWAVQIPVAKLPRAMVNVVIVESYELKVGGRYSLNVSVRMHLPPTDGSPNRSQAILDVMPVATTTYEKRADAYQTLHKLISKCREICAVEEPSQVAYAIADLRVNAESTNTEKQREGTVQESSLELAAVLLEIDVKELAKMSINKMYTTGSTFVVFSPMMVTFHCTPDGHVQHRDETKVENEEEIKDIRAHERSIVRFDTREWMLHHREKDLHSVVMGDIGYWTKDGTYTPPDPEHRVNAHQYEGMTPKDLLVRSMGLPIMAKSTSTEHGKAINIRHYQWSNTTDYTIKIAIAEVTPSATNDTSISSKDIPNLRISAKAWLELTPSIYHEGGTYLLCNGLSMEHKGEVYARIWKMLHDIKSAHDAGMESYGMMQFLVDVLSQAYHEGNKSEK
jgi:hypothetical protein